MGSSGGGGGYYPVQQQIVRAEETVTPAVARQMASNTESAQANQMATRSRLKGIRSTYNRFSSGSSGESGSNGSAAKLG